jgi:hypothetical protein
LVTQHRNIIIEINMMTIVKDMISEVQLVMSPNERTSTGVDFGFMAQDSDHGTKFKKIGKDIYHTWRTYMALVLEKQGLWIVVESEKPKSVYPKVTIPIYGIRRIARLISIVPSRLRFRFMG